jgi:hypothetical protein
MAHMTQNDAIRVVWDLALERLRAAQKKKDHAARDQWFLVINRMELEWQWLRRLRHDVPGLDNIPKGVIP